VRATLTHITTPQAIIYTVLLDVVDFLTLYAPMHLFWAGEWLFRTVFSNGQGSLHPLHAVGFANTLSIRPQV